MTALSTAEAALRRMPDDPAVPVTLTGTEAVALVAELDRLRESVRKESDAKVAAMRRADEWHRRAQDLRARGDELADVVHREAEGIGFSPSLDRAIDRWGRASRA